MHSKGHLPSRDAKTHGLGPRIRLFPSGIRVLYGKGKCRWPTNLLQHAIQVLNFLAEKGYKVSHAKAQMVETKVTYLGVQITHGSRRLSSDRVQGILQFPSPMTRKQLQPFLGLTGYCRIWITNYVLIARPLYESLKGRDDSIPLM